MSNKLFMFPYMPPGCAMLDCRRMSELTQRLKEALEDKEYPIIHINPDYKSIVPSEQENDPLKKYEKEDDKTPFLRRDVSYPRHDLMIRYGSLITPDTTSTDFLAVLMCTVVEPQQQIAIVYHVPDDGKNKLVHPLAVLKRVETVYLLKDKSVVAKIGDKYYTFESPTLGSSDVVPNRIKTNRLRWKHYSFKDTTSLPNAPATKYLIASTTTRVNDQNQQVIHNKVYYSLSLNPVLIKSISKFQSIALTIGTGVPQITKLYSNILSSASRQIAILMNSEALQFFADDVDASADIDQIYDHITTSVQNATDKQFPARHLYLVCLALLVNNIKLHGLRLSTDTATVMRRHLAVRSITSDPMWATATKDTSSLKMRVSRLPPIFYQLIARVISKRLDDSKFQAFARPILADFPQSLSTDTKHFSVEDWSDKEKADIAQFKLQTNDYTRLYAALGVVRQDRTVLRDKIEQVPFYAGCYATEVDRIAGAVATNELACVPPYTKDKITGYTCKHSISPTSMSSVPPAGVGNHPHAVAEFFNEGMVVLMASLLRQEHTIRSVPYFQTVTVDTGCFPWPLRPAIEITFESDRQYYRDADIMSLRYDKAVSTIDLPKEITDDVMVTFVNRLVKRASMLPHLPAIVAIRIDKKTLGLNCMRSHDAQTTPCTIIIQGNTGTEIAIVNTLSMNGIYFNQDAAKPVYADNATIDDFLHSEFAGLLPSLWNLTAESETATSKLAYALERICLGLEPVMALDGIDQFHGKMINYLTKHELFGIPSRTVPV